MKKALLVILLLTMTLTMTSCAGSNVSSEKDVLALDTTAQSLEAIVSANTQRLDAVEAKVDLQAMNFAAINKGFKYLYNLIVRNAQMIYTFHREDVQSESASK